MQKSSILLPALLGLTGCFKDTQGSADASASSTASEGSSTDTTSAPTTGEDSDAGTDGATGGGDTTTGAPCPGVAQSLPPARPGVMFVLDRSGSMILPWDDDGDVATPEVTRWSSLHAALATTLTTHEDRVAFGVATSPGQKATAQYSEAACVVANKAEVSLAPDNASTILDKLPAADDDTLAGADPIAATLSNALAELESVHPALPRRIVLISNGLPQCHAGATAAELFEVYDADAPVVAAEALAAGVPVHVLGLGLTDQTTPIAQDGVPDSVGYFAKYDELAMAGGTAPFVNATTGAALPAALAEVLEAALTGVDPCVVPLDVAATEPGQAIAEIDGEPLARVEDCLVDSGWHFVGAAPHAAIELCGAACEALKTAGAVDVFYCEGAPD
ncbi:MAG TPA: vWA domain-containing protein [Nannocystis sp.]|jgi:hypothetical protein